MTIKTPREILESYFGKDYLRDIHTGESIDMTDEINQALTALDEYYASRVSVGEIEKVIILWNDKNKRDRHYTPTSSKIVYPIQFNKYIKLLAQAIHNLINKQEGETNVKTP